MASGRNNKLTLVRLLGIEEIVIVMPQEPLAKIFMQDAHRENSSGHESQNKKASVDPQGHSTCQEGREGVPMVQEEESEDAEIAHGSTSRRKTNSRKAFPFHHIGLLRALPHQRSEKKEDDPQMLGIDVHMPDFQSSGTVCLPRIRCRQLPLHTDQVHRGVWRAREVLHRLWYPYLSRGQQAGKQHRNRGQEDPAMGCKGRNGEAEGTIRSSMRTLACILEKKGKYMDFQEVNVTFKRVGDILNRRLLIVEVAQDDQ